MAGSQLKRLKASLREQGIVGPQQSKKQKRKNAQDQKANPDKRLHRSEALAGIREQFNPFQFKTNARGPKFEVTTNKPANDKETMGIKGRPGLAKAMGEERRRQTILVEMQRRNKIGGLIDRRFGEDDPNMSLEDKMIERYTREQQRAHKKGSMFDLEDDDEPMGGLTHMGRPLFDDDDEPPKDDFQEDLPSGDESDSSRAEKRMLKRQRLAEAVEELADEEGQPDRKKTKKEIYDEIIAKSKFHKFERQAAKEEDTELREELDQSMPELQALLFQRQKPPSKDDKDAQKPTVIAGKDRAALEKDYDIRLKLLAADTRAQPADRTKTDEEQAAEESNRLKELEEKRLKRMRGEVVEEDEEDEERGKKKGKKEDEAYDPFNDEDADEFGLGNGVKYRPTATELGFDDEDDFLIDDDLVASGSELDIDIDDLEDEESDDEDAESESGSDDDEEFVKGILTEAESKDAVFQVPKNTKGDDENGIPYTFPCPQTHDEMLQTFEGIDVTKLPVAIQRIRALYHPKLDSKNKERLGTFSQALVQHVAYLGDHSEPHWFPTLESLSRHIHSLAKSFPIEVAKAYRAHIQEMEEERPLAFTVGDLVLLTAISTTFPTSDHFHQVVTPAMLAIARYLGQKIPQTLSDYATGTYLSILALQYQQFSKRYVPELMNFCLNTLCALAHDKPQENLGFFPLHEPAAGIRIKGASRTAVRQLNCSDCQPKESMSPAASASLKVAIISTTASILKSAAETWHKLPSFPETFHPALLDTFDPTKHYDPDRERAELAKLRAEHKRERKGAVRELRKDAAFMQRENLRVKKERDAAYEKKYKRLVAEIQGEEGRASNEYEREKAARKKKAAKARGGH
ncbi:nucleolar complex protein 14 [Collariella sp. IMI 366227]|nr:nucleolar complex protein 14 [Collariella sp. IMI 366227]